MPQPIYAYPGADDPETYDLENRICDPDGLLEDHIFGIREPRGATLLDVGAGGGFHAVRFAERVGATGRVFAAEPAPGMLAQLHRRLAEGPVGASPKDGDRAPIAVLPCGAESIPLPSASVDIAHARFAYFFGTDASLPGIAEVKRLLAPGGVFFVVDNDTSAGLFGAFCRDYYGRVYNAERHAEALALYSEQGFVTEVVESCWRAPDRTTLRRVLAMEFPDFVEDALARIDGVEVSYRFFVHRFVG